MQKKWYGNSFQLGMIGGGQLGRMFIQEALNYDVHVNVLDPDINAPCSKIAAAFTVGNLNDYETVFEFGKNKDLITVEMENINVDALESLEKLGKKVYPQANVLRIIQDKGLQKDFYKAHNIPTAPYFLTSNATELQAYLTEFPVM